MGKTLYLECYSGISGDMTVAALLDLGADKKHLEEALSTLPVRGFRTEVSRVVKSGLDACDFSVLLDQDNHDHDMEYLHGHTHEHHHHEKKHDHEDHFHGYEHTDEEHSHIHKHGHEHRGMKEIRDIIEGSSITDRAKQTALKIFEILAQAESKAHGVPVEEVHFHEVGAVDSIVDIVSIAVCLDDLDITDVIVPVLCDGTGFIRCQHGQIPVPVPAVVNVAQANHLKLRITDIEGELVTPTGAAAVAAIRTSEKLPEDFEILATGLGAGKRQYHCPGILRAMLIRPIGVETPDSDHIWRLETDIDDCSGEAMGYVMQLLLENGAREVHYTPVFMKKNRPAYELVVLCKKEKISRIEEILFTETTTIGIRRSELERTILKRRAEKIQTSIGEAQVKVCILPNGTERCYPEYDSASALAKKADISFREAYNTILNCWKTER